MLRTRCKISGMNVSASQPGDVRAVSRALSVLGAFTAEDHELSAADLQKRVRLTRPTLYRLLHTLERNGFVTCTGEPQRFRLGPAVTQLVHVWSASLDLGALALPTMQSIREQTGETVALFVPAGGYRTCVAELPSLHPLNFRRGVGHRERIVLGASGRIILAFADDGLEEVRRYAQSHRLQVTPYARELERVRRRGYAVSRSELVEGAVAVAAPFFDAGNRVAGSLAVFGPSARMNEARIRRFGRMLIEGAGELSKALGRE